MKTLTVLNMTRWKATFTWIFESLDHRFNSPRENKTPIIRLINLMDGSTSPEIASPSMRLINPIYFRSPSITNPISNNITPLMINECIPIVLDRRYIFIFFIMSKYMICLCLKWNCFSVIQKASLLKRNGFPIALFRFKIRTYVESNCTTPSYMYN